MIQVNSISCINFKCESTPQFESDLKVSALEPQNRVLCFVCLAGIADPDETMPVEGSQTRSFVNPSGIEFNLVFFFDSGCTVRGEPTEEFTWFPGFAWSYAVCPRCGSHLGWFYSSDKTAFFGLIRDMLVFQHT